VAGYFPNLLQQQIGALFCLLAEIVDYGSLKNSSSAEL